MKLQKGDSLNILKQKQRFESQGTDGIQIAQLVATKYIGGRTSNLHHMDQTTSARG